MDNDGTLQKKADTRQAIVRFSDKCPASVQNSGRWTHFVKKTVTAVDLTIAAARGTEYNFRQSGYRAVFSPTAARITLLFQL